MGLKRSSTEIYPSLAYPTAINIVYSSCDERSLITKKKCDNACNLDRLCSSLLCGHLQTALHIFWIFSTR